MKKIENIEYIVYRDGEPSPISQMKIIQKGVLYGGI